MLPVTSACVVQGAYSNRVEPLEPVTATKALVPDTATLSAAVAGMMHFLPVTAPVVRVKSVLVSASADCANI